MENSNNIQSNTDNNPLGIVLQFETRAETESSRTDVQRFSLACDYQTEADLSYFRDDTLREVFRQLYLLKNPQIERVLNEALHRSNNSFRVKQVVEEVRRQFNVKESITEI